MNIVAATGVRLAFGGIVAVDDVSFTVESGSIFSIIGPNGAGKTTLFNILSGVYKPHQGQILIGGENVTGLPPHRLAARGLARTFQNLQIYFRMSVLENVMVGCHLSERRALVPALLGLPSVGNQNRATSEKARRLLGFVGLARDAERAAGSLAYGGLRRLEIARALAAEPKVLLLDEPAAGCNPVETSEIENLVREVVVQGVTVLLVEHDMRLVMRISHRVLVLDRGRVLAEGTVEEIHRNPEVIAVYLGRHGAKEAQHAPR